MSGDSVTLQDLAFAIVQGDGTIRKVRGCTASRSALGTYLITIDPSGLGGPTISNDESIATVQCVNAAARAPSVTNVAQNIKQVTVVDAAGAAADSEFIISISRLN
jgi:hypothetical protein